MTLFGLTIQRKGVTVASVPPEGLRPVDSGRSWYRVFAGTVKEAFAGAWQRNIETPMATVLTHAAVYACVTLIAADIGKLRLKLIQDIGDDIWEEFDNPAYSPVLRKPNRYQTRIKFYEQWVVSKLLHGNTYVLKQRDDRGVVVALYVLEPTAVTPMVAPDGAVYYAINADHLSQVLEPVVIPQSEIIHDVMVPLFHPLVGVSPLTACGLAAIQGLRIQANSATFFGNDSNPGGVLTAPAFISDEAAARVKEYWESNFTGVNAGKVAVLGDGLKFEKMTVNAVDAQLIEQLKWTSETVCTAFHVPPYMIGVGPPPSYNNVEALNQQYYTQALQNPIESIELLMDEGLNLNLQTGVEFDLDQLIRMDTTARVAAAEKAIGAAVMAPNEARKRWFGLRPMPGGETPYMQQQNFSLAALAERDRDKPFAKPAPAPAALPAASADGEPDDEQLADEAVVHHAGLLLTKAFAREAA
jgi:HK97 family phage portal protein